MRISISEFGEVDENTDLWSLFENDAHGKTGLFAGQLIHELSQRAPAWRPKLVEIIRRGLASNDPLERAYALHGRLELPVDGFGEDLERLSLAHRDWLAKAQSPSTAKVLSLFFQALRREPRESESARGAFANVRGLASDSDKDLYRAWATLEPDDAIDKFISALDAGRDSLAAQLLSALNGYAPLRADDLVKLVAQRPIETKRRFVEIAHGVMQADQSPYAHDAWLAVAEAVGCAPEKVPERPVETEAMKQFTARIPQYLAAEEAAQPNTLPAALVLSSEVWVDGLRVPEGPPAQLFSLLSQQSRAVLMSELLLADILAKLRQLGWNDAMVGAAEARVRASSSLVSVAGSTTPEIELARGANVDSVYAVGPRTGTVAEGVTFQPVHELLTALTNSRAS
jgi:hypothetical protein